LKVQPRAVAAKSQEYRPISASAFLRALLAAALLPATSQAAAPELKYLYPAAGQQGTNVAISTNQADTWPNIWTDSPGIKFTPTPILGTYNVEITADAPLGPHLVRAWNAEGASAPRFFIVSPDKELISNEPNDSPASAQSIEVLPATISGRLDKNGDVDCYSVMLKRGQTLVCWVEAYVLASPFDGLLRVSDTAGRVLAFNHDYRTLDPLVAWTAPQDGTFIVQIMGFAHPPSSSVQLAGSESCVYRLHLTTRPTVRFTIPAMVQSGTSPPLRLIGWNLPTTTINCDATQLAVGSAPRANASNAIDFLQPLAISGIRELIEQEPDDVELQSLGVPSAITGRIGSPGDEDRYTFAAAKGRAYDLKIIAAALGSPLDAWLRVENPDHKEVAKNDDAKGRDPQLTWTAPADGNFTVVIGDVTHRGGDDYVYRFAITEPTPEVLGSIAAHSVAITAGKTTDLKVTIKRTNGFKSKLQLIAKDLPTGISASPVEVPEKDGEVTLQLAADAAAVPASQPFTLVLKETEGPNGYPVRYSIAATSEDNGVPQGFAELVINSTDQVWLAVASAPPP
jgi:hypothetical protein